MSSKKPNYHKYNYNNSSSYHHPPPSYSPGDMAYYDMPPMPQNGHPQSRSKPVKLDGNSHPLSSSNWSLASSNDSAERVSLGSVSSLPPMTAAVGSSMADEVTPMNIDLLTRTPWIDAETALMQIEKGKAYGNKSALWLRVLLQTRFYELGHFIQKNAGNILFVALLMLVTFCVGLKSVTIETNVEKLWVEEGGRLEKELQYIRNTLGEGFGSTNQIVIQTPRANSGSVLHANSLLLHLEALRTATSATVEMFDVTWGLKDICYSPSSPSFDTHYLDSMLENLFPCAIITPLDCFWEGSKLLGPEFPVSIPGLGMSVQWTNLNPELLVDSMVTSMKSTESSSQKNMPSSFGPLETIRKFMKKAGITTAYQKKPCLDPNDMNCPTSAPNRESGAPPDIGAELTGGCYGFATKYMHWPEDLIVGGVKKNKTGHITRAKAFQSIVQLMGEQEMFDYYQQTYKVHNLDWSVDKARVILEAWQRKFSEELQRFMRTTDFVGSKHNEIHLFTSTSLMDIMRNFSNVNFVRLGIGYLLMLLYAGYSLSRWNNATKLEKSQSFLGMMGVLIIGLSAAAGLGVCALIGLPFNASTTQIIPFLALGLGIDNMFLLAHTYSSDYMIFNVPHESRTAECLKQTGSSILLSSFGNVVAFLSASIIPIPALRCFALQTAILIVFISFAVIILFPALASLDLRFRSIYLSQTGQSPNASSLSASFFVNLCFYFCCCRTPRFSKLSPSMHQQQQYSAYTSSNPVIISSQITRQSKSSTDKSFAPSNRTFKQPYMHKQPYNCYYLNSIRSSASPAEHNIDLNKKTKTSLENLSICQCEIGQKVINGWSLDEMNDEKFKLMHRKCRKCGGDLRTQCDGQDNEEVFVEGNQSSTAQNMESATPLHPNECVKPKSKTVKPKFKLSIGYFVSNYYSPLLKRKPVKAVVLLSYIALIVISVLGIFKVNDGLDLTDIVPRNTMEHRFLDFQQKYFSFFNIFAVTKGNFDYPNNQKLLHEYHQSFTRIGAIIKNDDGGLPEFWLSMFRDWLLGLQEVFDREWAQGCITREKWFSNASDDGILAYKLLVQTGRVDNPVDKSLLLTSRLVDDQGIVNNKAFYNYLTAWVSNDPLAYSASQASFRPEPRHWIHVPQDVELKIPKSQPLIFTQIPFYLNNIRTTPEITATIEDIREICRRFEDRSLPNFPTGIPFTYWEQYVRLRFYLFSALVVVLAAVFVSICVFLLNPWTAVIIIFVLIAIVIELFGFMGWIGVKLSAIPAVILIVSIGISLDFLAHITISFLVSIGDRNRRMTMALQHMFTPVMHGIVSTLFGICMLAFSEFDFIIRYFFYVLAAVVLIATLNALVLLPVLLSILGPAPEIVPLEHEDRISTPSPPPSPVLPTNNYYDTLLTPSSGRKSKRGHSMFHRHRSRHRVPPRVHSEISLSTISEEPNSYQSSAGNTPTPPSVPGGPMCGGSVICPTPTPSQHEIVVQPEFVVETTITNNPVPGGSYHTSNSIHIPHATSSTPNSESPVNASSSETESPSPTSLDRDSPSGRSESVASNATSGTNSTVRSGSRCSSAASFTTTTTTSTSTPTITEQGNFVGQPQQSTTVTTKVMATAKLTVELHAPPHHASNSASATPLVSLPTPGHHHYSHPGNVSVPGGAVYMTPSAPSHRYQHSHMSTEPCRNCLGCMPASNMHDYMQHPPNNQTCYRAGAWNHGMIGPTSLRNNSSNQPHGRQQQYNWR